MNAALSQYLNVAPSRRATTNAVFIYEHLLAKSLMIWRGLEVTLEYEDNAFTNAGMSLH